MVEGENQGAQLSSDLHTCALVYTRVCTCAQTPNAINIKEKRGNCPPPSTRKNVAEPGMSMAYEERLVCCQQAVW